MNINKMITFIEALTNKDDFTSFERRADLIKPMQDLEMKGTDCSKCPGFCCTYYHNSMQITPLEAIEILTDLIMKEKLNSSLVERLEENAKSYRLHNEITDGRGRILRRNYSCPFFKMESLGCSISLDKKPYGCLGFNPRVPGVKIEGKCSSNHDQLEKRSESFEAKENRVNSEIKSSLELYWDKKPIPTALLEIISKLEGSA